MRLNHVNIPVADVEKSSRFFEEYFGFTCTEVKGNNALAVLKGVDGFVLVLMSEAFNQGEPIVFPSAFHIGFLLNSRQEVANQYLQLKEGGIDLPNEPANRRGIFGFYFTAPGKILVEVSSNE